MDREAYAAAVHSDDWLEKMCADATKRLKLGVAISAGRHQGMIRRQFQEARARMLPQEPAYGYGLDHVLTALARLTPA